MTHSIFLDEYAETAPSVTPAETLARYRRKTIVALTAGLKPKERGPLIAAAFALRTAARGPSKLARRMRRKVQLGLAGAH